MSALSRALGMHTISLLFWKYIVTQGLHQDALLYTNITKSLKYRIASTLRTISARERYFEKIYTILEEPLEWQFFFNYGT